MGIESIPVFQKIPPGWPVFQKIPPGWRELAGAATAPCGYELICNGKSRFSPDYKVALVEQKRTKGEKEDTTIPFSVQPARGKETEEETHATKTSGVCFSDEPGLPKKLNQLSIEQMKLRLLQDIQMDITICQLEGWPYKDYLLGLQSEIQRFLTGGEPPNC